MYTKPIGFWGLVVEPGKMYSQEVPVSFKMTMAALGPEAYQSSSGVASSPSKKSRRTIVMMTHDKDGEFALCSLHPEKHDQQPLDFVFMQGEMIHLRVVGEDAVHLSGYYFDEIESNPLGGYDDEELEAELNGEDIEHSEGDAEETDEDEEDECDDECDSEMDDFINDEDIEEEEELDSDEEVKEIKMKKNKDKRQPRIREITSDEEDEEEELEDSEDGEEELEDSEDSGASDSENEDEDEEEITGSEEEESLDEEDSEDVDDEDSEIEVDEEIDSDEVGSESEEESVVASKVADKKRRAIPIEEPAKKAKVLQAESKEKAPPAPKTETPKKTPAASIPTAAASKENTPNKSNASSPSSTLLIKTLPSGLKIEDTRLGQGIKAQKGRRCTIHYTITGENGKVIASTQGKEAFSFILGDASKLQKALGMGIQGMALGGERKLTIPSEMVQEGLQPVLPKTGSCTVTVKLESCQSLPKNASPTAAA